MSNIGKITPQLAAEGAFDGLNETEVYKQVDAITQKWFGFTRPPSESDGVDAVPKEQLYPLFKQRRKKREMAEAQKAARKAAKGVVEETGPKAPRTPNPKSGSGDPGESLPDFSL